MKEVLSIIQTPEIHLQVDSDSYMVFIEGRAVQLSRKEFEIIYLLTSKPGKVFKREEMFEKIWKKKMEHEERTIDVHILRLRKKLGDNIIYTLKGVGYKITVSDKNLIRH